MKVSINELHVKCRNAFRGLGFPPGADEEAAYIISWLEIQQFEGLKHFSGIRSCLKRNAFPASVEFVDDDTIDCSQCCGIAVVPGIFDFLRSNDVEFEASELVVNHCGNAKLFLPLIMKHIDSKHAWQVDGVDAHTNTQIIADGASARLYVHVFNNASTNQSSQIKIERIKPSNSINHDDGEWQTFSSLHEREQQAVEYGVDVNDTQWQFVLDIAKKSLVPASDESREKGAGGGDSND